MSSKTVSSFKRISRKHGSCCVYVSMNIMLLGENTTFGTAEVDGL